MGGRAECDVIAMNGYQKRLMDKPSIENADGLCAFCGRPAGSRHHIVPRSQGGETGPTVMVCGRGNESGCHGLLHSGRLHLDWDGARACWVYKHVPSPMKFERARRLPSWLPVHVRERAETYGRRP